MLVDRDCLETLLGGHSFKRSSDRRLMFNFKGRTVFIDLHVGVDCVDRSSYWDFPKPVYGDKSFSMIIYGGDLEMRRILYEDEVQGTCCER